MYAAVTVATPFQIALPWDLPSLVPARSRVPATIAVDGREWPLRVVRHRRARRYILRMGDDLSLRLTVPQRASVAAGLTFVQTQGAWVAREHARRLSRRAALDPDEMRRLREKARQELPARCLELAARHGAVVTRVSVRNQRSRWGSCSTRGTIALNWRLIQMPSFVSDYVILHELMHLRQPNHSRAFWREVASVCPEWREAERWLRKKGRDLL